MHAAWGPATWRGLQGIRSTDSLDRRASSEDLQPEGFAMMYRKSLAIALLTIAALAVPTAANAVSTPPAGAR